MLNQVPDKNELVETAQALLAAKKAIVETWKKQVQLELPESRGRSKDALEDHIPDIIEEMAMTMRLGVSSGSTKEQAELSKLHGRQRADLSGYTLEGVLEEYRIAREIIILFLNKDAKLSVIGQCLVNRILDRSVIEAGTEFSKRKNAESADAKRKAEIAQELAEKAQSKAEEAQDKAELANQAKSDFLANISHEIRTPLGAILGYTELMRDQTLSLSDRVSYAEVVNRNGRQLSTLINDILDISKIEAGYLNIENVPLSLASLVAEVTTLLRKSADAKGIKLVVEPWVNIPTTVSSDPTRLTQILTNMIGNAIKFTANGEVRVALKRIKPESDNYYSFTVTDTGIGISELEQSRLFRSFSQADTSTARKFGGTGLGLFLSKKLAVALGGDLKLEKSVISEGSQFVAVFRANPIMGPPVSTTIIPVSPGHKRRLESVRILLAEDSPDNQVLVMRYLTIEGAIIEIANDGEEATNLALKNEYDLVLLDIQMPRMDGYEVTRRLRAAGFSKPIIALTANAMAEEKEKTLSVGCDAHLTKPINRSLLVQTIEKFSPSSLK